VRSGVGVRVIECGGIPVASLDGEIDIANAAEVRNKLLASLSNAMRGLILDLSGLSYLDSRGVQLILELAERMKIRHLGFRIVMPERSVVKRILLLTHVDTVVPIDASVDEAVGRMNANGVESGAPGSPNPATAAFRSQTVPPGSSVDSL
jgi:anti-sigma B factor antagonist